MVDIRDLLPDIYIDLIPKCFSKLKPIVLKILKAFYNKKLNFIFRNALGISALTNSFLQWSLKKSIENKII